MRIVLDTNVLARAICGPDGPAGEVFRLMRLPHVLILSDHIVGELSRALRYARLRQMHGLDDRGIELHLDELRASAIMAQMDQVAPFPDVAGDPDDNKVIATAIAGRADAICTLDQHLRRAAVIGFCRAHGIEVMGDVELLRVLRNVE